MCRISSIKMMVMVLTYVKSVLGVVLLFIGSYLSTDINVLEAFGTHFMTIGSTVVFMALMSITAVLLQRWSTEKHNRFITVVVFALDSIVFSVLVYLGYTVTGYTYPEFPKDLQQDCLTNRPVAYEPAACNAYFDSDRVSGMRLYWMYYYTYALDDTAAYQRLTSLEGDLCCGFFAPMQCRNQTNSYPVDRITDGIDTKYLTQRVTCGPVKYYYPETSLCSTFADISLGIIGGCNYDYGIGYCLDVEVDSESLGCASFVEDFMANAIAFSGLLLMGLAFFNLFSMLLACCVWWKRKESDVFPNFEVDMGNDEKKSFRNVPDQFEVKPLDQILQRRRFLPMPRLLRLELARQEEERRRVQELKREEEEKAGVEDEVL